MNKRERYKFTKEEVKNLMKHYKVPFEVNALELWAYDEFDLRHNISIILGKVGKSFVDIIEVP